MREVDGQGRVFTRPAHTLENFTALADAIMPHTFMARDEVEAELGLLLDKIAHTCVGESVIRELERRRRLYPKKAHYAAAMKRIRGHAQKLAKDLGDPILGAMVGANDIPIRENLAAIIQHMSAEIDDRTLGISIHVTQYHNSDSRSGELIAMCFEAWSKITGASPGATAGGPFFKFARIVHTMDGIKQPKESSVKYRVTEFTKSVGERGK